MVAAVGERRSAAGDVPPPARSHLRLLRHLLRRRHRATSCSGACRRASRRSRSSTSPSTTATCARATRSRASASSKRSSSASPPTRPISSARAISSTRFRDEILPELYDAARRAASACTSGRPAARRAKRRTPSPSCIQETGLFDDWDVRVFGNDISRRVLQRRAQGRVRPQLVPRHRRRECCAATSARSTASTRCATRCARSSASARSTCSTSDDARSSATSTSIFCRNVLIYFDAAARKKRDRHVPRQAASRAAYLLLGHSESLLNIVDGVRARAPQERHGLPETLA